MAERNGRRKLRGKGGGEEKMEGDTEGGERKGENERWARSGKGGERGKRGGKKRVTEEGDIKEWRKRRGEKGKE